MDIQCLIRNWPESGIDVKRTFSAATRQIEIIWTWPLRDLVEIMQFVCFQVFMDLIFHLSSVRRVTLRSGDLSIGFEQKGYSISGVIRMGIGGCHLKNLR